MTAKNFKISNFIKEESLGGILLIAATVIAVIWANNSGSYYHLWHKFYIGLNVGDFSISHSLGHWVNDGLMAIFFFTVGLEIKREIMGGELSSIKKASFPMIAAAGGMLIPAIFYALFNSSNPQYSSGWGIPMATDIAFALGLMTLLGDRININIKIFLTALAIADDLGAILVIAIFYTENIEISSLINAAIFLSILLIANKMGVRKTAFYAIVGLFGVWTSFLFSGVHATIAGVLIAFTIPARPKITEKEFARRVKIKINKFENAQKNDFDLLTPRQVHCIENIDSIADDAHTPLQKLEYALHPIVAFFILPVFALANAGVVIEGNIIDNIMSPVALGVIFGLVLGKSIGITGISWLAIKFKLASLPNGTGWREIIGASFMAGIGFTMSIFIAELAFDDKQIVMMAKIGIFTASILSAIIGLFILSLNSKPKKTV